MKNKLQRLEKDIVLVFNGHKSKWLDRFSAVVSSVPALVVGWILVALFTVYYDFLTGVVMAVALVIVFVLHFVVSEGILKWGAKRLRLERKRPYLAYAKEVRGIGKRFSDSSFPSSHVAAMVGGLYVLVYFFPAFWTWATLITLLMCWSRLRNGMHYPTDIVAGVGLGLIYGIAAIRILGILL